MAVPGQPGTASQPGTATQSGTAPAPQTGERIVEVRIEGNHATEVSKLPKLSTRAGQDFDPQAIAEDVRILHRSRKFVDVHPKIVRVAEGVVVVFQVVERPMLRYVKYIGNEKVMTRTLRKKAEIDVGDSMDPYVVEEARRRIESFYHEKGYEAARVSTIEGNKPGDKGARGAARRPSGPVSSATPSPATPGSSPRSRASRGSSGSSAATSTGRRSTRTSTCSPPTTAASASSRRRWGANWRWCTGGAATGRCSPS
jgi:hypothetical protein